MGEDVRMAFSIEGALPLPSLVTQVEDNEWEREDEDDFQYTQNNVNIKADYEAISI